MTAERDERTWEWAQRVLRDAGHPDPDHDLAYRTAAFLAGQGDILDYPAPPLPGNCLLLVARAVAG